MTKNDEKIDQLKIAIAERKDELGERPQFKPVTNCMLAQFPTPINLNVATLDQLILLAAQMHSVNKTLASMKLPFPVLLGYTTDQWEQDIMAKIRRIQYDNKLKELKALEDRLNSLMSEDKRTEQALSDIESLLAD